ncbi:MAG: Fmu (Sun) domain-containing protein [Bacteroidetes bacterium]|nr:Fmu (Sun) domain-containing protein [Bacteroidota bacterium]MBS1648188.1 Fmu (Sun) domain-containing protein [Bacteroidota bacterium]
MSFIHQHILTTQKIIEQYKGEIPLAAYLKNYFSQYKKYGSKDRKQITNLCFNYFRLGNAANTILFNEKIKIALFLCNRTIKPEWNILFDDDWKTNWVNSLQQRIYFVQEKNSAFKIDDVFSFVNELSDGIDRNNFINSHFIQPDLFLRIRPNKKEIVLQKLNENNISFTQLTHTCLALPNASKIENIVHVDEEVVVQDYSSQRVTELLLPVILNQSSKIWDCCAASGGKSILVKDVFGNINLTVSDVRQSILQNLQKRFIKAGIKNYHSFVVDLNNPAYKAEHSKFNLILCDAPCSGSGTWGRTPEQLFFFKKEKINSYATLQKQIVTNAVKQLSTNGYFLYITCSVFKQENEDVVNFIQKQFHLTLIKMELLKGYNNKADTMFAALFCNKN